MIFMTDNEAKKRHTVCQIHTHTHTYNHTYTQSHTLSHTHRDNHTHCPLVISIRLPQPNRLSCCQLWLIYAATSVVHTVLHTARDHNYIMAISLQLDKFKSKSVPAHVKRAVIDKTNKRYKKKKGKKWNENKNGIWKFHGWKNAAKEVCSLSAHAAQPSQVSIVIVVGVACLSTALRPLAATAVAAVAVAGVDDFVDVLVEFDGRVRARESDREREGERDNTHPTVAQPVLGNSMRRRRRRPGNMIMCPAPFGSRSRRNFNLQYATVSS